MWQTAFPGYPMKTNFIDFTTLLSEVYSCKPTAALRSRLGGGLPGSAGLALAAVFADVAQQHGLCECAGSQHPDGPG